ncbi:hypothetical protein AHF37_02594 [Paragonimus kellicotti]|nr:hypothetical protein AHF37_02594 [Paragonimus kellicotti]
MFTILSYQPSTYLSLPPPFSFLQLVVTPCLVFVIRARVHLVQRTLMCGDSPPGPCGHLCDRKLGDEQHSEAAGCSAGIHTCLFACHSDPCPPCAWMLEIGESPTAQTRSCLCNIHSCLAGPLP